MWRFFPVFAVVAVAACDVPAGSGNQSLSQPWGPNETMSHAGQRDCSRPRPPADHPARSKYDRVCEDSRR